jgi:hypothetical protein
MFEPPTQDCSRSGLSAALLDIVDMVDSFGRDSAKRIVHGRTAAVL